MKYTAVIEYVSLTYFDSEVHCNAAGLMLLVLLCRGVLFVDVRQCQELAVGDYNTGQSDPYVLLKVRNSELVRTLVHDRVDMMR